VRRPIFASGGDARAVRRPGQGEYLIAVTGVDESAVLRSNLPNAYSLINTGGGDARAIRRPGYGGYSIVVSRIVGDVASIFAVPGLYSPTCAC
jgi:hypothetical protein